jgi:hypothetical protein
MIRKAVMCGSEEGRWKSTQLGNSLAAYPTSRAVWRGLLKKCPHGNSPAAYPTSCTVRWGGDALSFIKKEARSLPNPLGVDRRAAPGRCSEGQTEMDEDLGNHGGVFDGAIVLKGPPLLKDSVPS